MLAMITKMAVKIQSTEKIELMQNWTYDSNNNKCKDNNCILNKYNNNYYFNNNNKNIIDKSIINKKIINNNFNKFNNLTKHT